MSKRPATWKIVTVSAAIAGLGAAGIGLATADDDRDGSLPAGVSVSNVDTPGDTPVGDPADASPESADSPDASAVDSPDDATPDDATPDDVQSAQSAQSAASPDGN